MNAIREKYDAAMSGDKLLGSVAVAIAYETRDASLKCLVYSGITMPLVTLGVGYVVANWIGI